MWTEGLANRPLDRGVWYDDAGRGHGGVNPTGARTLHFFADSRLRALGRDGRYVRRRRRCCPRGQEVQCRGSQSSAGKDTSLDGSSVVKYRGADVAQRVSSWGLTVQSRSCSASRPSGALELEIRLGVVRVHESRYCTSAQMQRGRGGPGLQRGIGLRPKTLLSSTSILGTRLPGLTRIA